VKALPAKPEGAPARVPNLPCSHERHRFGAGICGIGRLTCQEQVFSTNSLENRKKNLTSKTEMLTPKGEHSIFPLFYQGDVRWENQFRRNRNRQNFVVGSYFLTALESSEKPAQSFWR
jgi:hypothetical protein